MSITYKDAEGIQGMRTAGRLASEVLDYLTPHVKAGITTREIDRLAHDYMKCRAPASATLNYQPPGYPPYPASLCTSVNHVVCHGIPNDKPLKKGDIAEHRRHRHQGRLVWRHQPHVHHGRDLHRRQAPVQRDL
jgi:methionyl aminopeptidase